MTQYKVGDLSGALLDAAVAECGDWKTAHEFFPTMTLDSTFQGYYIVEYAGEKHCMLRPRNPMRQDPQYFRPSTDWAIGGPIIQREHITIDTVCWDVGPALCSGWRSAVALYGVMEYSKDNRPKLWFGKTALVAAMRAYVASRFGETVELHD